MDTTQDKGEEAKMVSWARNRSEREVEEERGYCGNLVVPFQQVSLVPGYWSKEDQRTQQVTGIPVVVGWAEDGGHWLRRRAFESRGGSFRGASWSRASRKGGEKRGCG